MNAQPENGDKLPLEQGFLLETLRVDPQEGVVAGPGGSEKLDPKVMDVLVLMARHAGHVVPREELLTRLWPNAVVTDDALTRCFYELRRQLSSAGGDERYRAIIETLPKRGYRLNAAVSARDAVPPAEQPAATEQARRSRRPVVLAIALAATVSLVALAWLRFGGWPPGALKSAAPGVYSIAVLPFDDLSEGRDQQYLSDGIAEEIRDRLSNLPRIRVIARGSSSTFRGTPAEIPEIAAKLAVTHVLEGSVRRSGNRVRITAQLADAASNTQVWSETYDRELGDVFAIQDEIASSVATALSIALGETRKRGAAPTSAEAYDLFLQGEYFYNRRAPGDLQRAARYYDDALAIDPGYARAWAALAGVYSMLAYEGSLTRDQSLAKQGEAARKAVALDPGLAEGHARLAQYYWDLGSRTTSYQIFDKALALDPTDPLVLNFAAGIAMRNGDTAKALAQYRLLVDLDPLSATHHANLGVYLLAVDRYAEAKAELLKALELNPDFGAGVELQIVRILVLQRSLDEAEEILGGLPDGEARDHGLVLLRHAQGRKAEADAALDRLAARSAGTPDIHLAEAYAFRGMTDQAFQALEGLQVAVDRDDPADASKIWTWQIEMRVSPFLKPLHADRRWAALMTEPAT